MDIATPVILGIVEGLTEFLPVSSTGHLILATKLLGYDAAKWEVFNIVIQLGAILAVVVLYWRTFWAVLQGLARRDATSIRFTRNILVAFIPAAIIGIVLHKSIEALLGNALVVAVALILGGMAILAIEWRAKKTTVAGVADIPVKSAVGIGFIQCLSMIPGVSRSGATIMGALSLGWSGARRPSSASSSPFPLCSGRRWCSSPRIGTNSPHRAGSGSERSLSGSSWRFWSRWR